ncbi:acyl-CoA thioesterase [Kocuria turfanensis]|uniref:acyl-CoA thioesterase n=1 Tax=Kocuria turfanensis TaxID=388357 RepID=UPI004036246D
MNSSAAWSTSVPLRFDDINAAGHIGNVAIARIVDEARTTFLGHPVPGQPGYHDGVLEVLGENIGRLVGQQTIEFDRELWYSRVPLVVSSWISHIGRTSFSLACTISRTAGEPPAVLAEATIVLIDRTTSRAWPISDTVRNHLDRYQGQLLELRPRQGLLTT